MLGLTLFSFALLLFQGSSTKAKHRPVKARAAVQRTIPVNVSNVNDPGIKQFVTSKSSGAAVVRAQILLGRAKFSVGEIDGFPGTNLHGSVIGFQRSREIPLSGNVDLTTWKALSADPGPALIAYRITKDDLAGPFEKIPDDLTAQAKLPKLNYESIDQELGERFHSNPDLLHKLNPGKHFDELDTEIMVPNFEGDMSAKTASVVVSKSKGTVSALDAGGKILAQYPASIGSEHDPLPLGKWKVTTILANPAYFYNPELFWDADATQSRAKLAPGPKNPVGVVWIGISRKNYGIHGTPAPGAIGHAQSHGCVRLTNWDALELSKTLARGTPILFEQ